MTLPNGDKADAFYDIHVARRHWNILFGRAALTSKRNGNAD